MPISTRRQSPRTGAEPEAGTQRARDGPGLGGAPHASASKRARFGGSTGPHLSLSVSLVTAK